MIIDSELKLLLCQNADSRSITLANGLTKYATSPYPIDHLPFGSCTASSISKETWNYLTKMNVSDMNWEDVKNRFLKVMGLEKMALNVVFTPSGTDAETFVSHILVESSDKLLKNILIAPNEIGGGSVLAAGAFRFDQLTPDGSSGDVGDVLINRINHKVNTHKIEIRNESGDLLPESIISSKCSEILALSIEQNEQILVHLVAGSKTNVHTPDKSFLEKECQSIGENLHILVDAAQGRFSRTGIKKCLENGWIVMTTGSKFFGGPPFSSVILFPSKYKLNDTWNDDLRVLFDISAIYPTQNSLVDSERLGSLVRWYAALNEIQNYYQIPKKRRYEFLKWFEEDALRTLSDNDLIEVITSVSEGSDISSRLLQSNLTIITFKLRKTIDSEWCSMAELREIHMNLMNEKTTQNLVHLGQPVTITPDGSIGALRLAFGGVVMQQMNRIVEDSDSMEKARLELCKWLKTAKKELINQLVGVSK
tara:strand:+ start:5352 stop:6791 length:1440 start_codon:yes stop_codon:yes gene_type:complete